MKFKQKTEIGFVNATELRTLNATLEFQNDVSANDTNKKNEKLFEQYAGMLSNFLQVVAKDGNRDCELKDFYEYVNMEDEFDVFWLEAKLSEFGYVTYYTDETGGVISW